MSSTRRRSDRPGAALRRRGSLLEPLETRQVMSASGTGGILSYWNPYNLPNEVKPGNVPTPVIVHPIGVGDQTIAGLGTEGKSVTGRDRQGNVYTITVYGPGEVIVNDVTNDGVLDDDIATIQLVGTDPRRTHVIGSVVASDSTLTDLSSPLSSSQQVTLPSGEVAFNQLIAQQGVGSIVLSGFVLTQTQTPLSGIPYSGTGIYLPGGVQNLSLTGIIGNFDTSQSPVPITVAVGMPNIPLHFKPSIRIDSITNTVFDSTSTSIPAGPQTVPSIQVIVNGAVRNLELGSVSQAAEPAASQYLFPNVGTTGRTSFQATAIDTLVVSGASTNVTFARTAQPFQSPLSGLTRVGSATFGPTDALGLDVNGPIGRLVLAQGLGSPIGLNLTPAQSGTPSNEFGYPANGFLGGLITATSIRSIQAAPANVVLLSSNNPFLQTTLPGFTNYYAAAGSAMTYSAITTTGNINAATVIGDSTRSEIKSGYNVYAATSGQEPVQGTSQITGLRYRGNLIDSVISASYRPSANGYQAAGSAIGTGRLVGTFDGTTAFSGMPTALGNAGAGFYARYKSRNLPG